ncbi:hypothetical protein HJFPF1_13314 [Paramyrothecium foliicola]|nr:hypothetical protein HJFPF1_13314 [Paramyrothecium foliicola]
MREGDEDRNEEDNTPANEEESPQNDDWNSGNMEPLLPGAASRLRDSSSYLVAVTTLLVAASMI